MATLKCFSIAGVKLWFWSHDHEPPHFHAQKGDDWEVRVNLLETSRETLFQIVWQNKPFSSHYRKTLEEKVAGHRVELLQEWDEQVQPQ